MAPAAEPVPQSDVSEPRYNDRFCGTIIVSLVYILTISSVFIGWQSRTCTNDIHSLTYDLYGTRCRGANELGSLVSCSVVLYIENGVKHHHKKHSHTWLDLVSTVWSLLGLWTCQSSCCLCGYSYLQLNGSTAKPIHSLSPNHMELRPTMTEISDAQRGESVVSNNVSRPVSVGAASAGGAPSAVGTESTMQYSSILHHSSLSGGTPVAVAQQGGSVAFNVYRLVDSGASVCGAPSAVGNAVDVSVGAGLRQGDAGTDGGVSVEEGTGFGVRVGEMRVASQSVGFSKLEARGGSDSSSSSSVGVIAAGAGRADGARLGLSAGVALTSVGACVGTHAFGDVAANGEPASNYGFEIFFTYLGCVVGADVDDVGTDVAMQVVTQLQWW